MEWLRGERGAGLPGGHIGGGAIIVVQPLQ